jgi:hypothetical protein
MNLCDVVFIGSSISLNLHPSGTGGIIMPISYITGNNYTYEKSKDNIDFN